MSLKQETLQVHRDKDATAGLEQTCERSGDWSCTQSLIEHGNFSNLHRPQHCDSIRLHTLSVPSLVFDILEPDVDGDRPKLKPEADGSFPYGLFPDCLSEKPDPFLSRDDVSLLGTLPDSVAAKICLSIEGRGHEGSSVDTPFHLQQPLNNVEDALSWDSTAEFISHQRTCLSEGWPVDTVFGSTEVDLDTVFSIDSACTKPATVPHWVSSVLEPFETLGVPERLGLMVLLGHFIRWRIFPCLETYQKVPEFLKPTPTQLRVPHCAWIDFIPWPDRRDAFILEPECYTTLQHSFPLVLGFLSVNWSHSPAQILEMKAGIEEFFLSPMFQDHVSTLDNWSVDLDAVTYCPALSSKVRL